MSAAMPSLRSPCRMSRAIFASSSTIRTRTGGRLGGFVARIAPEVRTGVPRRHLDSRVPARRSASGGRVYRCDVDPAAREHPRDDRVRVPHLACVELVATPHRGRDLPDELENTTGIRFIRGQPAGTVDGLRDVGDVTAQPEPYLVAEDPESACPAGADRSLSDDPALLAAQIRHRGLLDDEGGLRELDLQGGVEEVARST